MIESAADGAGRVLVTFRLPDRIGATEAFVVGEFNAWSRDADAMQRDADGFVLRVSLPLGRTYRFRYLLDGNRWANDWMADAYVPNEYGGDDSVVDLSFGGPRHESLRHPSIDQTVAGAATVTTSADETRSNEA